MEKKLVKEAGIFYKGVSCGKLRRYFSWQNFLDVFRVVKGVFEAEKILKNMQPDVVFSKGGYVGLPVVVAAHRLKIPIVIHESDLIPGLANKLSMRLADKICISFEETRDYLKKVESAKVFFTGNPVREEILKGNEDRGYKFTGLNNNRPIILVMGGSQGAAQINELVKESLSDLLRKYQIVHLTGENKADIDTQAKGYKQFEYLGKELKDVYAVCDLIVSRAGANSLAEIALLKKKAVIIPLSTKASRGDQIENAKVFCKKYGWSMLSGNINKHDFVEAINVAYHNQFAPDQEAENGIKKIVDVILNS